MQKGFWSMIKWYDERIWKWVIVVTVIFIAAFTMAGCKSKEYVTVPEYHTQYICRTDTVAKQDSIYVKDSVYVYRSGDTVVISKIAYRDRWHNIYKVRVDTIIKQDSIPYPMVRELTKNEQRMMALGRNFIVIILIALVMGVLSMFYHNKKC